METDNAAHAEALRLRTRPGIGKVLGPVISLEIDGVSRFKIADKFCSYAGLGHITHSSSGKTAHGRMLPFCNRWLKWAPIEAACVAIGCSDYFGSFYKRHRSRGKVANEAITITARRMAKIAWKMLKDQRDYSTMSVVTKPLSSAALVSD
jgi:transposase